MLTEDSTVYHQISLNFKCVVLFHPGLRDYWIVLQTISHTAYIHTVQLNDEVQSHSILSCCKIFVFYENIFIAYDTHEKFFSTLPGLVIWSMTTNTKKT